MYVPKSKDEPGDEQGQAYITAQGLAVEPGEMFEMPCPGEDCPYFENKFCKNIGRLLFMLPNVPKFGVYEITTSSYNGIVNVLSMARAIKSQAGRLAGIPFALKLGPQQVQADGKAKTVHILQLEFRGSIFDLQKANRELAGGRVVALLPEPGEDVPEDLMPKGGGGLEEKLTGKTAPAASTVAMPRRKAPVLLTPSQQADPLGLGDDEPPHPAETVTAQPAGPELELESDPGLPVWRGDVIAVKHKKGTTNGKAWTLYTIEGKGAHPFSTFDERVKGLAEEAMERAVPVQIVYEETARGQKVIEIRMVSEDAA